MAIHQIIHMISVWHPFMATSWPVNMVRRMSAAIVLRRALVWIVSSGGNFMVIYMVAVHVVKMSIVKIVGVAIVLHGRVATIFAVGVRVSFMFRTGSRTHHFLHCLE
jgi:hypothetical protein